MSREVQLQAALARVPAMSQDQLKATRQNALAWGEDAAPLLAAIDARLTLKGTPEGMRLHRMEFARHMLGMVEQGTPGEWIRGIDLARRAQESIPDNPFVVWAAENSARMIPLTDALADAREAFPAVEYEKRGDRQGAPVYYRRRPA